MVFLLTLLLAGQPAERPIKVMVLKTEESCRQLGTELIQGVIDTIPERGKRMTFTCDALLEAQQ